MQRQGGLAGTLVRASRFGEMRLAEIGGHSNRWAAWMRQLPEPRDAWGPRPDALADREARL